MESKVIILLAIASLAQSTYVPNLTVDYGLSTADAAILKEIIIYQEDARVAHIEGTKFVFDILGNLTAAFIAATDPSIDSSAVSESLCRAKNAIDVTFDSILVALETSCSTVANAKAEAYEILESAFSSIESALELAACGDYAENQAAIESYQTLVLAYFQNLTDLEFATISTCLDSTDSAIVSLIEVALEASLTSASRLTEAIFDGIKAYAATASGSYPYVSVTCDIEVYRDKATTANRNHNEQKFAVLRTIFINANLGQNGTVASVAKSQYSDIVSLRAYIEGTDDFFRLMTRYLRIVEFGLHDDNYDDAFSDINVTFARILADFDVGDGAIFDLISFIHPDAFSAIATAREYLHTSNSGLSVIVLDALNLASNQDKNHSVIVDSIETLKNATIAPTVYYTQYYFDLIRNNLTFDDETEATLTTLQSVALNGTLINTYRFFDGFIALANAIYAGEVSEDDYSALQDLQDESDEALNGFTQGLTAACLAVYQVISAS